MGSTNPIIIEIQEELQGLLSTPSVKPCIFKVDSTLRNDACDNMYEPIISIGPYHHKNPRLKKMQQVKLMYLKRLLQRTNEETVDKYFNSIAEMEARARQCYSMPFDLTESEFVKVMLLDGCLLIEFLRYGLNLIAREGNDPIFTEDRVHVYMRHDIFLLENQLPFFVLNELFNMTKTAQDSDTKLITLASEFAHASFLNLSYLRIWESLNTNGDNINHLLDLMHYGCRHSFLEVNRSSNDEITKNNRIESIDKIKSASGLEKFGIKLRTPKGDTTGGLMNITFVNGELRIPQLIIFDETESQLRNLIAYEQYIHKCENRIVSNYQGFMQSFTKSTQDVELLRDSGIILNCTGNDEDVCSLFYRIGKNVCVDFDSSNYSRVISDLNRHCSRPTNKWLANLRTNYFDSPWSVIKVIAAVVLLLLTLTQTIYTVVAFHKAST